MTHPAWKAPLIALAILAGLGGMLAAAFVLMNPPSNAPLPRHPVPGPDATLSSTAQAYMEAAQHNDCGMTRALTTANTTAWCDGPKLLAYKFLGRSGDDGECMGYSITTDTGLDGTDNGGTEGWSFCYRLTKAGWRLWDQGQG
ncbi:hypothetical protein ACFQ9V_09825 [Leifsonia sp. NPDC056665]|uniref:hypothetical protein n=1 Tax=Leifsonia sp. NPDC056665 TaxID=3345901 RepID=UPI00369091CB